MNLKIIPLGGGAGTVTSNMWVYQYGAEAIIVDCGIGFPEDKVSDDILIPDITYLKTVKPKINAIILTHGHDDHYAAVPHLLQDLGYPPIYALRLTAAMCQEKIDEFNLKHKVQIIKETDKLTLGVFTIEPIHMTHSVPYTFHYMITTPVGRIYHGSDFKIDMTPLDHWPPNLQKVATLSQSGVLCMLLDCLRSERQGITASESSLTPALKRELNHWGGRLIFTTMSSQIHRIQQAVDVAMGYGRKICFIGRSMETTSRIARELGYLHCPQKELIKPKEIKRFKDYQLCLIISGSQGQESSSLTRYAAGKHKVLKARPSDKVIYSTDIIPGNEQAVYKVIDQLSRLGLTVVYQETTDDLHVSGHAAAVEQQLMMELVNPRYLYPIGGSFRHMYRFKQLAGQLGFEDKQCLLPESGQVIELSSTGQVSLGEVLKLQLPRFNQNG